MTTLTIVRSDDPLRLREIMTATARTISVDATVGQARATMAEEGIHHLPVMDSRGDLAGLVSDRDLRNRSAAVPVINVMSNRVVTATPETTVRQAANLLRGRSIGCLPIRDGRRLVGIVTISDLLALLERHAERPTPESTSWTLRRRGLRRKLVVASQRP
jgi:acetoin utilization protein AcuB